MKALIATGLGVMALGGVLVANSGRSASAGPATFANQTTNRTTLVNCGEGRQAMIWADPSGSGAQRVECVPQPAMAYAGAMPVSSQFDGSSQFVAPGGMPQVVTPVVQERVVYRDRVASAPVRTASARRASTSNRTYSPASSAGTYERSEPQTRTWKKSAIIIGGSTAAGAGVGAVLDGKSGAKKGAVVGLVGATIYDIATRTKK